MVKISISIFLTVLICLVSFQELTIFGLFKLNQEYIASSLCENRDEPVKVCNGNCHLTKVLQAQKEKPAENVPMPTFEFVKVHLLLSHLKFPQASLFSNPFISPFHTTHWYGNNYRPSIFHPPPHLG